MSMNVWNLIGRAGKERADMNKLVVLGLALAALMFAGTSPASAATTMDAVADQPGATLLLPYFAVDLAKPAGLNTIFTINNASATAVLAHVTIWSDLSVPVFAFNVYLTGYDSQTVNMRNVIAGSLPRTASAGQDPGDLISHHGIV